MQAIGTTSQTDIVEPIQGGIEVLPYDNDVTLLYKWVAVFQVPVRLIIVRPRTAADADLPMGTNKYVFESLVTIVNRLANEGESPADVYDIVTGYKNTIDIDDIAMAYFSLLEDPELKDPMTYRTINNIYHDIDNTMTTNRFEDNGDLQRFYSSWSEQVMREYALDEQRLNSILDIQDILADVAEKENPIVFSPVTINSVMMSFSPTFNGKSVTAQDGIDIFNASITSRHVPYIKYNDQYGRPYSRIYTGDKVEDEPNYSLTVIPASDSMAKNTIYMTLWLGDPENNRTMELHNAPGESFYTVVYRLDSNYLTIESPVNIDPRKGPINLEVVAAQRTQQAFPNLVFNQGREVKVRGDFNIWDLDFDETSFLDMVLSDSLMNVYLYVEENIKPFALKKRLDVHYRSIYTDISEGKTVTEEAYISNSASVSLTLNPRVAEIETFIDVVDPATGAVTEMRLPAGAPYIQINISQAESRNTVDEFMPIFQLLLRYYLRERSQIEAQYQQFLPELAALKPLLNEYKRKTTNQAADLGRRLGATRRGNARIDQLRVAAPDLFVKGYPRRCQAALHPIIVPPEEVEAWRQRRVGPNQELRQVMPFPKDNPQWYFVCPNDEHPYPGVKLNKTLENKEQYPYIPCCGERDQMTEGANSKYQAYLEGRPIGEGVGAKADKKPVTRKILSPNRVGFLPESIEKIVKHYSKDYVDMVRFGIQYTPNSFLHCVCTAIDEPNYFRLNSFDDREAYVTRIRQHMLTMIRAPLLKQEMYDYSDQEIMDFMSDNNKFLDPSLFYRAIEEIFNINVYVFAPPPPTGINEQLGSMVIPRFRIFHAHALRIDRPTIVILRTLGSESDSLEYPHCELIVDYDIENSQIMKLFGPSMTEICHSTMQQTLKTLTWSIVNDNTLQVRGNMYYHIDHLKLFQSAPISQFIDDNGKLRALTFNVNNTPLTVVTIPSQPENVPVMKDIARASLTLAMQMLGEPTAVTRNTQGLVDGLWFQIMDITHGEYVPIIPIATQVNKPIGPPNPIVAIGTPVTGRLTKLRRTLNIIKQLTIWLYELARSKRIITPTVFAEEFMVMDPNQVQDSATYYDLSRVPRRLPIVETAQEAIRILTPTAPTFFNDGKLVMYSPLFANRMIRMLQDYSNLRMGMAPIIPEFLDNYYETESNFREVPNSKIFLNEKDLTAWLLSLKSSQNYTQYFNIRDKIDINMGFTTDPFMYRDEDGRIFIVQNVIGGSLSKALAVAETWEEYKVNIGSDPIPWENEPPVHMIYGISPGSTLVPIQDNTNNLGQFINILYYGSQADKLMGRSGRYAALLRVL